MLINYSVYNCTNKNIETFNYSVETQNRSLNLMFKFNSGIFGLFFVGWNNFFPKTTKMIILSSMNDGWSLSISHNTCPRDGNLIRVYYC